MTKDTARKGSVVQWHGAQGHQPKQRHTPQEADKECQVSLVNYHKDGSAFLNLMCVILIGGGVVGENLDSH